MRKQNAVLSMVILALFLFHAIVGAFQLTGLIPGGMRIMKIAAWVLAVLIAVHFVIGSKLTADTLKAQKKAGTAYLKENRLFWTRRVSGFAIMIFIVFHILIFLGSNDGAYRLNLFEGAQLISQILLVISAAVHVVTNIKPLMIALGAKSYRVFLTDVLFVLSVLLLFMGFAFVVYYLRWNVF